MESTTQVITVLTLLLTLVVSVITTQFIRRRKDLVALRDIPAYRVLPLYVGEAIEANRPVHLSFGSAGLGGSNTPLTLAAAELFYHATRRAAMGSISPIVTLSDSSALPLGFDTLRRAYTARGLLDRYHSRNVRWYPAGPRNLAFAAALTATMGDDHVATNVLAGSFGMELALAAHAAQRRGQSLIATSDQLEGQAVALVFSDEPLIGEEVFVAGAYLGETASLTADAVTLDVLRWLLILALLIPAELALMERFGVREQIRFLVVVAEVALFVLVWLIGAILGLRRR